MITTKHIIIGIISVCLCTPTSADNYRITKIKPENKKIEIGNKLCDIGDSFSDTEIVKWNDLIPVQALQAECVNNSCTWERIELSKNKFRKKTSQNISLKKYASLISKGNESKFLSMWDGDTLKLNIVADDKYTYRLRFNNNNQIQVLNSIHGHIILTSDLFYGHSDIIKCYIDRRNKSDRTDIEIVGIYEIELLRD